MGQLVCINRPADDVVGLDEAKSVLHIDTAADDLKVRALLAAATQRLDGAGGILGRALAFQTWRVEMSDWPADGIELPLPPTIRVNSIDYLDGSGARATLDPTLYRLIDRGDNRPAIVLAALGATFPTVSDGQPDAVRVEFDCGYMTDESPSTEVPAPIRQAIMLMADEWYNRGDMSTNYDLSPTVNSLIYTYKVGKFGYVQYIDADGAETLGQPDALLFEFTRL